MLMGEVATLVKYKLPVKVIVIKNNVLGEIKWEQMVMEANPEYGVELQPIDCRIRAGVRSGRIHAGESVRRGIGSAAGAGASGPRGDRGRCRSQRTSAAGNIRRNRSSLCRSAGQGRKGPVEDHQDGS